MLDIGTSCSSGCDLVLFDLRKRADGKHINQCLANIKQWLPQTLSGDYRKPKAVTTTHLKQWLPQTSSSDYRNLKQWLPQTYSSDYRKHQAVTTANIKQWLPQTLSSDYRKPLVVTTGTYLYCCIIIVSAHATQSTVVIPLRLK